MMQSLDKTHDTSQHVYISAAYLQLNGEVSHLLAGAVELPQQPCPRRIQSLDTTTMHIMS